MHLPDYSDQGAGDVAVFLLHGVGGGQAAWDHNAPALASAGFRCIAWDMPGYGQSPIALPYSMQTLAATLLRLVAHIGAKHSVLLGHSMGGMVAQQALAMKPDAIAAAILFATSPAFAPPAKPGESAQVAMHWQQAFLSSRLAPLDAGLGMANLARQLVSGMFAPATPNKTALHQATEMMSKVPEATYRLALAAIAEFDQRANLPRITVPLLCLAAELDKNAPPRVLEKMAAQAVNSSGARYACIEGAGHLANMEKPDAFNNCVVDFLQQHFQPEHQHQVRS